MQLPLYFVAALTVKLLLLLLSAISSIAIYRLYFHPLSSVPGPRLAAVSNIWHAYHARNGRMLILGKTLHKKYGPVVRIGPNEVWMNSRAAFSKIYSVTSGFAKSDFYVALALNRPALTPTLDITFPDTLDLLGEFDLHRYRLQRRLIGLIYSKRSLLKHEKAIDGVLLLAISRLRALKGAEVDLKEFMHITTVECLTAIVVSWSPGYLKSGTDFGVAHHAYLGWRRKSVFGLFPWAEIMDAYFPSIGRLFAKVWGLTFKTPPRYKALFPVLGTKTKKRINAALRPSPPFDKRKDLAYELIQLHKEKPEFTEDYLKRMIMSNFGAGHETMTSTLISVFAMLGSHPDVQKKSTSEIARKHAADNVITYADAVHLQYTQAAMREAQRLHPTIGMSLSRTVPATGLQVNGFYFPPGTTVGCNPVSLHRNPEIFGPDTDDFQPDRWLDHDRVVDMNRHNLIFGGGARTCPGQNLAELIIFKLVPTLIEHFEIQVEMPREEDIRYYFMAMLTGVRVRFIERCSMTDETAT